jgi:hypothetical protein
MLPFHVLIIVVHVINILQVQLMTVAEYFLGEALPFNRCKYKVEVAAYYSIL